MSSSQSDRDTFTSGRDSNSNASSNADDYPNIYRGPSESTWRKRNAAEIEVHKTLQQTRNSDLSIHLYNAAKLHQLGISASIAPGRRKGGADGTIWRPPKHWTAWPLPPQTVPREAGYAPGDTLLNLPEPYVNLPVKPSLHLEEMLLAQILRSAKEKLATRPKEEFELKPEERKKRRRQWKEGSRPSSRATSLSATDEGVEGRDFNPNHGASSEDFAIAANLQADPELSVSITNDDSDAHTILKPQIRHMLSQFDTLLSHLHIQRASYAEVPPDRDVSTDTENTKSRSRSRGRQSSRSGKRAATPAPSTRLEDHLGGDHGRGRSSTSRPRRNLSSHRERSRKRQLKLGLRDWKDVLAVAAMDSFPTSVIRRAGERCENLFSSPATVGDADSVSWRDLLEPLDASVSTDWVGIETGGEINLPTQLPGVDLENLVKIAQGPDAHRHENTKKSE